MVSNLQADALETGGQRPRGRLLLGHRKLPDGVQPGPQPLHCPKGGMLLEPPRTPAEATCEFLPGLSTHIPKGVLQLWSQLPGLTAVHGVSNVGLLSHPCPALAHLAIVSSWGS